MEIALKSPIHNRTESNEYITVQFTKNGKKILPSELNEIIVTWIIDGKEQTYLSKEEVFKRYATSELSFWITFNEFFSMYDEKESIIRFYKGADVIGELPILFKKSEETLKREQKEKKKAARDRNKKIAKNLKLFKEGEL